MITAESSSEDAFPSYDAYLKAMIAASQKRGTEEALHVTPITADEFPAIWERIRHKTAWLERLNDGYAIYTAGVAATLREVLESLPVVGDPEKSIPS